MVPTSAFPAPPVGLETEPLEDLLAEGEDPLEDEAADEPVALAEEELEDDLPVEEAALVDEAWDEDLVEDEPGWEAMAFSPAPESLLMAATTWL